MEKIIFLSSQELDSRNRARFGIDILNDNISVEYWDLRSLYQGISLKNKFNHKVNRTFKSYYQLFKNIFLLKDNFYIIDFLSFNNIFFLVAKKILKLKGGIYLYINVGSTIQNPKKQKINFSKLIKKVNTKNFFLNAFIYRYKLLLKKIFGFTHDLFFIGGSIDINKFNRNKLIYSHNLDYNLYLKLKSKKKNKQNYIVFLDQNLPEHSDYSLLNLPNFFQENYYNDLKKFLINLEKTFNKRVLFCVHPRTKKNAKYLKNFKRLVFGKTAEKIKNSSMVVGHDSLALNFGILFRKPLLLVKTPEMNLSNKLSNINYFASEIGCKICDINDTKLDFLKKKNKVNYKKYEAFIKKYIKFKGEDKNSWEIVKNYINENKKNNNIYYK